jgi:nucleoside-diphosphate-sugar epimerase
MQKGRAGQKYIISSEFVEVDDMMGMLERITGRPRPALRLSPAVMNVVAHVSSFVLSSFFPKVPQRFTPFAVHVLQLRRRADTGKAQRELGYQPTSVEDALREAYEWFVEAGEIPSPLVPVRSRAPKAAQNGASARPSTAGAVS